MMCTAYGMMLLQHMFQTDCRQPQPYFSMVDLCDSAVVAQATCEYVFATALEMCGVCPPIHYHNMTYNPTLHSQLGVCHRS